MSNGDQFFPTDKPQQKPDQHRDAEYTHDISVARQKSYADGAYRPGVSDVQPQSKADDQQKPAEKPKTGDLTKDFSRREFDSHTGARVPDAYLDNVKELAENLQVLRDHLDKPVKINCGYRTPEENARTNPKRATTSQHLWAKAADIHIDGVTPQALYSTIEQLISEGRMHNGGLGIYDEFVHYDIRDAPDGGRRPARWDRRTPK
jgi:uncharacterized protein YcbK (DUF882 family)